MEINTKLQKVQMSRDASDLRLKDSKDHVEEMEKMLHLIEEVHVTKRCGDLRLQKAEEEALILNRKIKSLEKFLKKCPRPCAVPCLHNSTKENTNDERRRLKLFADRNLNKESVQHNNSHQLVCNEHQEYGFQEEVKALREQHTTAWQQLSRTEEETCLQALFDKRTQERENSQDCLAEKKIKDYQQQMGETRQPAAQYSSTSHNPHQENYPLNDQLNQIKLEILHLKTELDDQKLSLATLKHEKCKLQASETEHVRRVQEETLDKQQLSINLEKQSLPLVTLTEEHKELQLLYSCQVKQSEGVVLQLQSHLKHVQTELDQVKCTLRTLKQKDDHGFQVARSMQKEITGRRRQNVSLQRKIQSLEETKNKLFQEKVYQNLENEQHQFQGLTLVHMEKKQLAKELEDVKSRNKHLREQISELEAVIYQMSRRLADCQEFIQLQAQEYYRLKLKHIMDLKQVRPFSDHGSEFSAHQGEMSKNHRSHTAISASSVQRRRPAPERVQSTAFSCDKTEIIGCVQRRRKHSGSKSGLKTNKLQDISICQEPLTSPPAATRTNPLLLGCRSPVHTLLTSNPNS